MPSIVSILRNNNLGQQTGSGDALIDDMRRNRCLHQRCALVAPPFTAHMAFHRKEPGLVIELLGNILADTL
jgi:hypothetical protein